MCRMNALLWLCYSWDFLFCSVGNLIYESDAGGQEFTILAINKAELFEKNSNGISVNLWKMIFCIEVSFWGRLVS